MRGQTINPREGLAVGHRNFWVFRFLGKTGNLCRVVVYLLSTTVISTQGLPCAYLGVW